MNWLPIYTYDDLKKKPKHAAFYFEAMTAERRGDCRLGPMVCTERHRGPRICTHWCPLPDTDELDKG